MIACAWIMISCAKSKIDGMTGENHPANLLLKCNQDSCAECHLPLCPVPQPCALFWLIIELGRFLIL